MPEQEREAGLEPAEPKNAKEKLYDKLPFTYRQVDIFAKIAIAALVLVLVLAVLFGRG